MKRTYRKGLPHHIYSRGLDGNIIFYTIADCVFYTTLYSCFARKYRIRTLSFSLMPNHTHSLQCASSSDTLRLFNQELLSRFTTGYNGRHNRKGPVFQKPFGIAPKIVGKQIRSCISYINNNASVGGLAKSITGYRWNLVAYLNDEHPFSAKTDMAKASIRLRRALKLVDYYRSRDIPLGYDAQKMVFSNLDKTEKSLVLDYVLSRYGVLDEKCFVDYFGSFSRAMMAMEANSGSEYDIPEDWEDYSIYPVLSRIARKKGVCLDGVNFDLMDTEEIKRLADAMLSQSRATTRQVEKYLHLKRGG